MTEDPPLLSDDQVEVDLVDEVEVDMVFRFVTRDDTVRSIEAIAFTEKRVQRRLHRFGKIAQTNLVDDTEEGAIPPDVQRPLAFTGPLDLGDIKQAVLHMHRVDSIDPSRLGVVEDGFPDRLGALFQGNPL